jgi:hypothetical protein
MNKIRISKDSVWFALALLILFIIYVTHAPTTVQTGDSGELAASAYRLLVAHPPGYPFWVWLNHLWINIFPFGTTYFGFSFFNILISLSTLIVLGSFIKSTPVKVLSVFSLGLFTVFWRYAEIPEVFSLHVLLSALVIVTGVSPKKIKGTNIPVAASLMPLFFSLGIAHHLTIIFLMPFVLWVCWKQRTSKWLYISIATGIAMCAGLYLSMLAMHPQHMYSWGNLQTVKDVWEHFLRKEYGTFALQLQTHDEATPMLMKRFFYDLIQASWGLLLLAAYALYERLQNSSKIVWSQYQTAVAICCAGYVFIFIPLMKVVPVNFFAEVSERFFLLPIFLFVLLVGTFIADNTEIKSLAKIGVAVFLTVTGAVWSFTNSTRFNDFSDNTIVEDYASNILNIAGEFKNPILFSSSDTEFFGIRYVQLVEGVQPNIIVVVRRFFATDWFVEKAIPKIPNFVYSRDKLVHKTFQIIFDDIILPNIDNFTFITADDEYPSEDAKVTYLPLGFMISKGSGIELHKTKFTPQFRSDLSVIDTSPYLFNSYRSIFSRYTYYFAAQAQMELKKGNVPQAIDALERVLGIAPYTYQALYNLCSLKEKLKIEDKKCELKNQIKDYFDYFRFHNIKANYSPSKLEQTSDQAPDKKQNPGSSNQ